MNMLYYENKNWIRKRDDKEWLVMLRQEPRIIRIPSPTRPAKARSLGYKKKKGYIIIRGYIRNGLLNKKKFKNKRKQSKMGLKQISLSQSKKITFNKKIIKKYHSLKLINSYIVANDSIKTWFEGIMIDPILIKN